MNSHILCTLLKKPSSANTFSKTLSVAVAFLCCSTANKINALGGGAHAPVHTQAQTQAPQRPSPSVRTPSTVATAELQSIADKLILSPDQNPDLKNFILEIMQKNPNSVSDFQNIVNDAAACGNFQRLSTNTVFAKLAIQALAQMHNGQITNVDKKIALLWRFSQSSPSDTSTSQMTQTIQYIFQLDADQFAALEQLILKCGGNSNDRLLGKLLLNLSNIYNNVENINGTDHYMTSKSLLTFFKLVEYGTPNECGTAIDTFDKMITIVSNSGTAIQKSKLSRLLMKMKELKQSDIKTMKDVEYYVKKIPANAIDANSFNDILYYAD